MENDPRAVVALVDAASFEKLGGVTVIRELKPYRCGRRPSGGTPQEQSVAQVVESGRFEAKTW